jgi:hypothetical protein
VNIPKNYDGVYASMMLTATAAINSGWTFADYIKFVRHAWVEVHGNMYRLAEHDVQYDEQRGK